MKSKVISLAEADGVKVVTLDTFEISDEVAKFLHDEFPPDRSLPEKAVIFDLTNLAFLGTTGISVLLRLLKHVKLCGARLAIVGLRGACLDVLRVTNLIRVFEVFPSVKAAQEAGATDSPYPTGPPGGATPPA